MLKKKCTIGLGWLPLVALSLLWNIDQLLFLNQFNIQNLASEFQANFKILTKFLNLNLLLLRW